MSLKKGEYLYKLSREKKKNLYKTPKAEIVKKVITSCGYIKKWKFIKCIMNKNISIIKILTINEGNNLQLHIRNTFNILRM